MSVWKYTIIIEWILYLFSIIVANCMAISRMDHRFVILSRKVEPVVGELQGLHAADRVQNTDAPGAVGDGAFSAGDRGVVDTGEVRHRPISDHVELGIEQTVVDIVCHATVGSVDFE